MDKKLLATFDPGWVGKRINGPPRDDGGSDSPKMGVPAVADGVEAQPLLYVLQDGTWFACWRREDIGFRK